MAAAGYYVFHQTLAGGEYVRVPNIARRHVTDASYLLAERGLELGRIKEMPDDQVPKGHVIAQRPAAGKVVRTGRKVYPTVSSGTLMVSAPSFLRRTLRDATEELEQGSFALGSVARIPHAAPRDTIIGQDPAPPRLVRNSGEIHFLVSDGPAAMRFFMPNLEGESVRNLTRIVAPMRALIVPKRVDTPGVPRDVVLDQQPVAGSQIHEGATIFYYVCPSGTAPLPDSRRSVTVSYTVPPSPQPRAVRIDTINRNAVRETLFPQPRHYVHGAPPKIASGRQVTIPNLKFLEEITLEVFLDGVKVRSYYYQGDAEPVVTDYGEG